MALLLRCHRALRAPAVKEFANPRLVGAHQLVQRIDRELPVHEHGDAMANGEERGGVMGDDDDRDPEALIELLDQRIDAAGRERIEVGRRLVEKEDSRVEREGTRQRCALDHAARELRRELEAGLCRHPRQLELHRCDPFLLVLPQRRVLAHRQHDVLGDRQ